ncbi:MAG: patatin-like phospholipase family protein, partial [Janthinobacterium lividum]
ISTFGDLGLLNALDPYTFKNLVITAVRRDNGQLTIFNPEDTPNVEIALACRASGSLPLFFKPVIIDGVEYVDGGFRDNNPTKYFSGKERSKEPEQKSNDVDLTESKQKEVQRILIFAFGSNQENDVTHSAIYSAIGKIYNPSKLYKLLVDVMYKGLARVGGQFKYTETIENTAQDLRKKSHDTVILDTPGVGTISFKKANEKYDYLYIKGYIQTMGHVNNHGLGTKGLESVDPNLDHKRMILEVYERSTSNNSWTSKINKKANSDLLSMLETDKWKQPSSDSKGERKPMDEKERRAILETLIISTASRGNTSLCDIKNIAKIVDTLNNKTTSIEVRRDFAKILANSRNDEDIYSRKFKSRDFKELIDRFNKERNNADRKTPQMSLSRNF